MNFKKYFLLFASIVAILFFVYVSYRNISRLPEVSDVKYVKIAGKKIKVDLALDETTQQRGLSGRTELKEDEGMLFVFKNPGRHSFWMKDMNFPIDMIWLDGNFRVVYIKKDALLGSYPEVFTPDKNSTYVLEVISGFSEKNNLKEGDKAEFLP